MSYQILEEEDETEYRRGESKHSWELESVRKGKSLDFPPHTVRLRLRLRLHRRTLQFGCQDQDNDSERDFEALRIVSQGYTHALEATSLVLRLDMGATNEDTSTDYSHRKQANVYQNQELHPQTKELSF